MPAANFHRTLIAIWPLPAADTIGPQLAAALRELNLLDIVASYTPGPTAHVFMASGKAVVLHPSDDTGGPFLQVEDPDARDIDTYRPLMRACVAENLNYHAQSDESPFLPGRVEQYADGVTRRRRTWDDDIFVTEIELVGDSKASLAEMDDAVLAGRVRDALRYPFPPLAIANAMA